MKAVLYAIFASLLMIDLASARKSYIVKNEYSGKRPSVRATSYPSITIYSGDDGDEFTITLKFGVKLGWKFDDDVEENLNGLTATYRAYLDLGGTFELYFSPLISFPRFIYLEETNHIDEFEGALRLELYYFYDYDTLTGTTPNARADHMCFSVYFLLE